MTGGERLDALRTVRVLLSLLREAYRELGRPLDSEVRRIERDVDRAERAAAAAVRSQHPGGEA